jgi:hypothetical protein
LGPNEFGLEVFEVVIVEVEPAFERPVGKTPLVLE